MSDVVEVSHPLIDCHLSSLRDRSTPAVEFRRLVRSLTSLVMFEATKNLETEPATVETPITTAAGRRLSQRVGLAPILRAGLGMVDVALELMPSAEVWHLGLYRDEATARPVRYYIKLPENHPVDVAFVLDPMLATGGSVTAALEALRDWGVARLAVVSLIAAVPGIDAVRAQFPSVPIYVCRVDPELNAHKFIVPGLGDAGDRIFNTMS